MKRILVPALILAGIAIVSCKKTEPVAPAEPGSCTVSGTVKADLD